MFVDTQTTDQTVAHLQYTSMELFLDIKEAQGRVGLRTHLCVTESTQRDWNSTQESAKEEMKLYRLGVAAGHSMSQVFVRDLPVAGKDRIDLLVAPSSFKSKFSSHIAINLDLVPLFLASSTSQLVPRINKRHDLPHVVYTSISAPSGLRILSCLLLSFYLLHRYGLAFIFPQPSNNIEI